MVYKKIFQIIMIKEARSKKTKQNNRPQGHIANLNNNSHDKINLIVVK